MGAAATAGALEAAFSGLAAAAARSTRARTPTAAAGVQAGVGKVVITELLSFTAPSTGAYDIIAFGAQGGVGGVTAGGLGAEIGGEFILTQGETLRIVVGGAGVAGGNGGGGGGGSFVIGPDGTPLVIAGGGGGGSNNGTGGGGLTGTAGGVGGSGGAGGTGGSGGAGSDGGGGGGFSSAGGSGSGSGGGGTLPDLAGGAGGSAPRNVGGLGGGGGGGFFGGGGGGGYSGGGGGGFFGPGGGGGSFDAGTSQVLVPDFQMGNGLVEITERTPAVPEPSTWGMMLLGFAGLGFVARRVSRTTVASAQ